MSVLTLQSIQELLSHLCTAAGKGRREGKRRAENIHHPAWPRYPHPLTKTPGNALQPAQLSMDELTSAEITLLYTVSLPRQKRSTST